MALKIDLSKLNKASGTDNTSKLGFKPISEEQYNNAFPTTKPTLYVETNGKFIKADLSLVSWGSRTYYIENTINLIKLKADQTTNNSFDIIFTEGEVYNLDDIIAAKKRDNADSPLILKVNKDSDSDTEVLKAITELIFIDYGLKSGTDYNMKIADTNSSLYYKNAVTKIPDFYDVFTIYFNRYYNIYYNKLNAGSLGTLSLTSVIEEIQSVHDNVYGSLFNADTPATNAQFADSFYNKPQVEYEMGSMPTDTNGNATGFDDLVNADDFSLTIDKDKAEIGIAYKQKAVSSSYVSLATAAEAVFGLTDEELEFGDGSGLSSDFGMTDIEIEFKSATES